MEIYKSGYEIAIVLTEQDIFSIRDNGYLVKDLQGISYSIKRRY